MNDRADRFLLRGLLILLFAFPCSAQQSGNLLDTARVVLGPTVPQFRSLIDLDADGRPDAVGMIALSTTQTQIALYRNAGDGTFTPAWQGLINWSFAGEGASTRDKIVVGDFDGDGLKDDFAVGLGLELRIFQGGGVGAPSASLTFPLPDFARNLSVVDVDQNGTDDLVIGVNSGIVPFRDPLLPGAALDPTLQVNGTVNDAPLLAIRLANQDLAVIFAGRTWRRTAAGGWSLDPNAIGLSPGRGNVADIDGDGDLDGIVFRDSGHYQVIRQAPGSVLVGELPIPAGGPGEGLLVDLDGDGDLDAVGGQASFYGTTEATAIQVSANSGNGTFGVAHAFRGAGLHDIAGVADLDGDGDLDVLAGRSVLFGNPGENLFERPCALVPQPSNGLARTITLGDMDDDGDLDLSPDRLGFLTNDGRGIFRQRSAIFLGATPPSLSLSGGVGDWNSDGLPDLAISNGSQTYAAWNRGGGFFQWSSSPIATGSTISAFTARNLAADLDGDGDLDSLSCGGLSTSILTPAIVTVAFNDGLFNFPLATSVTIIGGACAGIGDFDGDGLMDILTRPGPLVLSRLQASGSFTAQTPIMINAVDQGHALVDDVDNDGDLDVICHQVGTGHVLLTNDGNANFTQSLISATSFTNFSAPNFMGYALLDLDGDGIRDLVASPASETEDCSVVLRGFGGGVFATTGPIHACLPASTADIDGDGDLDLIEASRPFLHRNPRLQGASAAFRLQYGIATAGSGGAAPILGVGGSLRELGVATLRIRNGFGGAPLWIAITGFPTQLANYPLNGITTYVDPFSPSTIFFPPTNLSGPANGIGVGTHDQSYTVPFGIAGFDLYHQAFFFDPGGPSGASASNALRIRYGL